jgi:hypothetical protein
MANSSCIATAKVGPDRAKAGAGKRPGEMHCQVAGDDDRCPAARPAQYVKPNTKSLGNTARNGVDCHDRADEEGFVGQDRGDHLSIKESQAGT